MKWLTVLNYYIDTIDIYQITDNSEVEQLCDDITGLPLINSDCNYIITNELSLEIHPKLANTFLNEINDETNES